jgi:DNA-binding protein Fis
MNTLVAQPAVKVVNTLLAQNEGVEAAAVPLRSAVQHALKNYFDQLGEQDPVQLYELVLQEVERPLLVKIMEYTKNNQSRAAILLGISRGTLRKKLKEYGML